ncbi:MAG: helix-turn-helix domain-containing protein [Myxococcota bacterium]
MSQQDVVQALVALGYSLNEGRAYSALLERGPSTGYEVSQRANVPRSAVYGALRRLVASGAARSLAGSPERFVAAPAESVVDLLEQRFDASKTRLLEAIRSLDVEDAAPDAFSVHGYKRVIEEANRMIRSAERKIVLSGWPREFELLTPALADAASSKVKAYIFSHARASDEMPGIHFSYGVEEAPLEAFWQHRICLVVDDVRTLIGSAEETPSDNAVISQTRAIAELATSQICLDITLLGQRYHHDVGDVLSEILGDRIGSLDNLLKNGPEPVFAHTVRPRRRRPRAASA